MPVAVSKYAKWPVMVSYEGKCWGCAQNQYFSFSVRPLEELQEKYSGSCICGRYAVCGLSKGYFDSGSGAYVKVRRRGRWYSEATA